LGADDPSQIVFTSGATESNNWIFDQFAESAVSPFEHSSIRERAVHFQLKQLPNEGYSLLPSSSKVQLVSVMSANNETGALLTPPDLPPGVSFHSDVTQSVGRVFT
jgi:cysteine desulfurase